MYMCLKKRETKCKVQHPTDQVPAHCHPPKLPHRVGGRDGWRSLLGCSLRSRWPSIYQNHSKSMSLLTLKDKSTRGNINSSIIIMLLTTNKTNITVVSCCFFNIITHCLPSFGGHHNIMANEIHPLKTNKNNFRVPSYEKWLYTPKSTRNQKTILRETTIWSFTSAKP